MKGIILAGGNGTRLYPLTKVISKQLLPIYDKPMIYYPLSTLMSAGIRDILIITTTRDINIFRDLLGDGSNFGISLSYSIQERPDGLAQAFIMGEKFLAGESVALILGDNIFYGNTFSSILHSSVDNSEKNERATILGYYVNDPERFGVAVFDENEKVIRIEEKPLHPKSNYAVTGLYFYPGDVCKRAMTVKKSTRGELEITTLNEMYLNDRKLDIKLLGREFAWFDTGTFSSLLKASNFVETIENRQKIIIGLPEVIAYMNGWINEEGLLNNLDKYCDNSYKEFLNKLINKKNKSCMK